MLQVRVDQHRCVSAGNCITMAPTAFGWHDAKVQKALVLDPDSIDREQLRLAALSCPTNAIEVQDVDEMLPWQLAAKSGAARRVVKTFMFTDIVGSTNLLEAMGDESWNNLLTWHNEMLRALFDAHSGQEIRHTGDGFFVSFDDPDAALACATAIQHKLAEHRRQHGFAPQVRIGVHASEAAQVAGDYQGLGVHQAARIGALATAGEILTSRDTVGAESRFAVSAPRSVTLRGVSEPIEVVAVEWH